MADLKKYVEGVKGIIFDYGGTLDTDGEHWSRVILDAWKAAGVEVALPVFREAYVQAEKELERTESILPAHDFRDVLNIKINLELQWLAHQGKFPADKVEPATLKIADICESRVRETLVRTTPVVEKLAEKYSLAVVSNFYGNLSTVLEKNGLSKYFKKIIDSGAEGVRKPDVSIFLKGVEGLGLRPEECLVIGDSFTNDIQPALEAGCRAVWLKGLGWWGNEDYADYPNFIKTLSELENFML